MQRHSNSVHTGPVTEASSRSATVTEASSRSAIVTEASSRSATVTEASSRSATVTEASSRSAIVTEASSRSATVTEASSRSATVTEASSRSITPQATTGTLKHVATTRFKPQSGLDTLRRLFLLVAVALLPIGPTPTFADNADASERWTITGQTMGPIQYNVVIADPPSRLKEDTAKTAIANALASVNSSMSTYQPESDISRFNRHTDTDWFPVDPATVDVIQRALEITELTRGAFDVRVASAVQKWNFGPDKTHFELPSVAETDELSASLATSELTARSKPPAIRKSAGSIQVDLSAIAKGYAVDRVVEALQTLGCENMMVEVGGEVFAAGHRAGGQPWRIGIERPTTGQRKIETKVALTDRALATSGDYRNYFEHQGQRYSHTIDPATCRPVTHFLASATVVADDCMTADALATAVMVMGATQGHELAKQANFELFTIDRDGGFDGQLLTDTTSDFPLLGAASDDATNQGVKAINSIWPTFLGALLVFSIAIIGMAVGAIFANKPVRGSCGGLSAMSGAAEEDASCSVCAKPVADCPK